MMNIQFHFTASAPATCSSSQIPHCQICHLQGELQCSQCDSNSLMSNDKLECIGKFTPIYSDSDSDSEIIYSATYHTIKVFTYITFQYN